MSYEEQINDIQGWQASQDAVEGFLDLNPLVAPEISYKAIPSSGVYRAVYVMNGINGQEINHVMHGAYTYTGAGGNADPADLLTHLKTKFETAWAEVSAWIDTAHTLVQVVSYVYDAFNDIWVNIGSTNMTGAGTTVFSASLPQQTGIKLTTKTVIPGVVGGAYISGFAADVLSGSGTMVTAALTDVASHASELYSVYSPTDWSLYPGIWSVKLGTLALARQIVVNNVFDQVRKRKLGVGN